MNMRTGHPTSCERNIKRNSLLFAFEGYKTYKYIVCLARLQDELMLRTLRVLYNQLKLFESSDSYCAVSATCHAILMNESLASQYAQMDAVGRCIVDYFESSMNNKISERFGTPDFLVVTEQLIHSLLWEKTLCAKFWGGCL